MKTVNQSIPCTISPLGIEAVMRQARQERAEVMRDALASLGASIKAAVARLRPIRRPLSQTGAWANWA